MTETTNKKTRDASMIREEAWKEFQEKASLFYPYYFGNEDELVRNEIFRVMSKEFTPPEITAEEAPAENAATMSAFSYAFLRFGDAAEAYDRQIGGHEFEGLSKKDSPDEYEKYKTGQAPSKTKDRLQTFGQLAAHLSLPLLIVTGFLALTRTSRTVIWILLGVWVLLRILAFIGLPIDHLLYLPRRFVRGFQKGHGIFKPFLALIYLALAALTFAIWPTGIYIFHDQSLRREKKYQEYKAEHLKKRYDKIMEKVRAYWSFEGMKVQISAKGYPIYQRDPSYYQDRMQLYRGAVLEDHPLWNEMLTNAYSDKQMYEASYRRTVKRDEGLSKIDEWSAWDSIGGESIYDEAFVNEQYEHYREKEDKAWARVAASDALAKFIERRVFYEELYLLSRNEFKIRV